MSPLTETDWHRRMLGAFVKAEALEVELERPTPVETVAGGQTLGTPETLPPQTFRLVPFKRRLTVEYGFSRDGEAVKNAMYVLVGPHDADVQEGDYFDYEGTSLRVAFVSDLRKFRTAAALVARGRTAD